MAAVLNGTPGAVVSDELTCVKTHQSVVRFGTSLAATSEYSDDG
jgi:hypothetical protein